jgi:hypothetical protein
LIWPRLRAICQAARGEVGVDGGAESLAQVVGFEQVAEFQERGGVGHALGGQVNAGEAPQRLAVVEGVFEGFVGQAIPLLEEIDPQHPLQSDGRATALALGIVRRDDRQESGLRNNLFHAREELLPAGGFLFGGKLDLGKTGRVGQAGSLENPTATVCNKIARPAD